MTSTYYRFVLAWLLCAGCSRISDYKRPSQFENKEPGVTKVFADAKKGECLAIFEKIQVSENDTATVSVKFNNTQILDSTFSNNNTIATEYKLSTEYGILPGRKVVKELSGTHKSEYERAEIDFSGKIQGIMTYRRYWFLADSATLVEVTHSYLDYFDRIKNKSWERYTIDSTFYGYRTGVNAMKTHFVDEKRNINWKLVRTIRNGLRPLEIDCSEDERFSISP